MSKIMSLVETDGNATIKLVITPQDLVEFSNELITRTLNEVATVMGEKNDRLITKEEAKQLLGVCDATLWHWDRKDYLKPVKVGCKVRYRETDVRRILGSKKQNEIYEFPAL